MNKISDVVLKPSEVNSIIENVPEKLPILPLRDIVIFPYMIFPVLVGREQSIRAANYAADTTKYIFLSTQKKSNIEDPSIHDLYADGTIAKIVQILKLPNGLMKILVDGIFQGRIKEFTGKKEFFEAKIEIILPEAKPDHEMNALYFSRAPIPFQRNPEDEHAPTYYKHLGFYAYRKGFLLTFVALPEGEWERFEKLEQLRALEYGYRIKVVLTDHDSIEVDTPDDLKRVEEFIQKNIT